MKDVLLQKKNLNIVVERYKYNNINKIKAATDTAIGITILFLLIFCFKFEKMLSFMVILSLLSVSFIRPFFLPIERNFCFR